MLEHSMTRQSDTPDSWKVRWRFPIIEDDIDQDRSVAEFTQGELIDHRETLGGAH
jgi:hypothetical protein